MSVFTRPAIPTAWLEPPSLALILSSLACLTGPALLFLAPHPRARQGGQRVAASAAAAAFGGAGGSEDDEHSSVSAGSGASRSASSMREGLLVPEGCELSARIVRCQEEHCAVWGCLQSFAAGSRGGGAGQGDGDGDGGHD